ncbi:transcriptional regulator [Boudabousia liubingyangii]|uniref:metal-dependent transcriptional regulator n=1 Tax=Boudabousia liubingyangii TaxID=1921764 RepID=UPI00093C572E|nr:metal-dependent transcriptional regulator [Boudabousia liubingyangii]OKL47500.1 transcriptional regulator [Boudabousia liubingyangii]
MSVSKLPTSGQNFLKIIWALSEWSGVPVTTKELAARTGLRASSVSEQVKRLTQQGLLEHERYGAIELTAEGREYALQMVRRHRLIETFLVEVLDLGWEQVHAEAEELEHAVSDFLVDRIDEYLGKPTRDPHGDPIPARDGTVEQPNAINLLEAPYDKELQVERISDSDPEMLKYLEENGVGVGSVVELKPGAPFSDSIRLRVAGTEIPLGQAAASELFVSLKR